jgi:uncharacterized protein YlaI
MIKCIDCSKYGVHDICPLEYAQLKDLPINIRDGICPKCDETMSAFLRGTVQSGVRKFFGLPYYAIICRNCKNIIGWEKP